MKYKANKIYGNLKGTEIITFNDNLTERVKSGYYLDFKYGTQLLRLIEETGYLNSINFPRLERFVEKISSIHSSYKSELYSIHKRQLEDD